MTTITIDIGEKEMNMIIDGHAGYNAGQDIVCAAISVLGQAAARTMLDMKRYGIETEVDMGSGKLQISAKYLSGVQREVDVMMEVVKNGFLMLEEGYPDYVKCRFNAVQTKI